MGLRNREAGWLWEMFGAKESKYGLWVNLDLWRNGQGGEAERMTRFGK